MFRMCIWKVRGWLAGPDAILRGITRPFCRGRSGKGRANCVWPQSRSQLLCSRPHNVHFYFHILRTVTRQHRAHDASLTSRVQDCPQVNNLPLERANLPHSIIRTPADNCLCRLSAGPAISQRAGFQAPVRSSSRVPPRVDWARSPPGMRCEDQSPSIPGAA